MWKRWNILIQLIKPVKPLGQQPLTWSVGDTSSFNMFGYSQTFSNLGFRETVGEWETCGVSVGDMSSWIDGTSTGL